MEIKVKYHCGAAKPIRQAHPGEWIDLRAADDVYLEAGKFHLISLGVSIQLPYGYEAIIASRSSTFKNYGVIQTNGIGVIDHTYCGDADLLQFPCYATADKIIHAGDRIAQLRIQKTQGDIEITEVEHLSNKNRGGIGSTGTW